MGSTPATPPTPPPMACRPDGFTRFRGRVLALPACSCACSQAEEEADHLRRLLSTAQRDAEDARSRTDAMARQRDDALHYADEREDWASQAAVRRMHAVGGFPAPPLTARCGRVTARGAGAPSPAGGGAGGGGGGAGGAGERDAGPGCGCVQSPPLLGLTRRGPALPSLPFSPHTHTRTLALAVQTRTRWEWRRCCGRRVRSSPWPTRTRPPGGARTRCTETRSAGRSASAGLRKGPSMYVDTSPIRSLRKPTDARLTR